MTWATAVAVAEQAFDGRAYDEPVRAVPSAKRPTEMTPGAANAGRRRRRRGRRSELSTKTIDGTRHRRDAAEDDGGDGAHVARRRRIATSPPRMPLMGIPVDPDRGSYRPQHTAGGRRASTTATSPMQAAAAGGAEGRAGVEPEPASKDERPMAAMFRLWPGMALTVPSVVFQWTRPWTGEGGPAATAWTTPEPAKST
jgi:hypothetical protein